MNRHAIAISAVFLKDLRQLWPVAVLAAATILAAALIDFRDTPAMVRNLLVPMGPPFIAALFLVALIHQDAPASLSHEWLTRPIGGPDVLAAKFLMLAAAVLLPLIVGPTISAARDGTPVSEALLLAISDTQFYWLLGFDLLIVAVVTSTLIQTAGVLVGVFALFLLVSPFLFSGNGSGSVLGAGWIDINAMTVPALIGGSIVLWLQYADRRTNAARGVLGAAVVLVAATFFLQRHDVLLAVQRLVTGQHQAADKFDVALAPGCFEARYFDPSRDPAGPGERWRERVVVFTTGTRARGLPEGWRMMIGRVQGTFVDSRGVVVDRVIVPEFNISTSRVAPDGEVETPHTWMIPRGQFDAVSGQVAGLRLDYDVSLVEAVQTGEIAADGKRHDLPGLGACVATASSETSVQVSCFKAGQQPEMLAAQIAGENSQRVMLPPISFGPDLLRFSPGTRRQRSLRLDPTAEHPRVKITAYEARAIVTRSVSVPGMLGGPSCVPAGQP